MDSLEVGVVVACHLHPIQEEMVERAQVLLELPEQTQTEELEALVFMEILLLEVMVEMLLQITLKVVQAREALEILSEHKPPQGIKQLS
jgi:hypothetical protein